MSEVIIGLNAFHGDSAACLVVNGKLVAAPDEERLRRLKHWTGCPSEEAKYCLASAGLSLADVDRVAVNRDPSANALSKVRDIGALLREKAGDGRPAKGKVGNAEHQREHIASAVQLMRNAGPQAESSGGEGFEGVVDHA